MGARQEPLHTHVLGGWRMTEPVKEYHKEPTNIDDAVYYVVDYMEAKLSEIGFPTLEIQIPKRKRSVWHIYGNRVALPLIYNICTGLKKQLTRTMVALTTPTGTMPDLESIYSS